MVVKFYKTLSVIHMRDKATTFIVFPHIKSISKGLYLSSFF